MKEGRKEERVLAVANCWKGEERKIEKGKEEGDSEKRREKG